MIKPKILYLVQLPPPIHGASLMNKYLLDSKPLSKKYFIDKVNLDFTSKISNIGKFSFDKLFKMIVILFKIFKKLVLNKYDLIYFTLSPVGGAFYRDVIFVLLLKLFKTKIIYHLHGKGIQESSNSYFNSILYKFVFKNSKVINLSKLLDYDIERVYYDKIFNVPNGIPKINIPLTQERNNKEIIYLSALKISKGILVFIEALELLKKRNILFTAKIIGSSTIDLSVKELNEIIKKKGLDNVVSLLGPVYGQKKYEHLGRASVFCFPTFYRNECFPLSILEAMMMGTIPVSTDNGAIPEIIDDSVNGYILPTKNVEKLSDVLSDLLLMKEVDLVTIRQNAILKYSNNYDINKFENNIISVFESILSGKN